SDFSFDLAEFAAHFSPVAKKFGMEWRLAHSTDRPRVAIFVSKYDHCLQDLLYRHQNGELRCEFPLIISNHPDNQRIADFYQVPYVVVPVTKDNKHEAEKKQLALIRDHRCDLVVLARYMQVLSTELTGAIGTQHLINIHHSFLPAFIGSRPYHQAFVRGVKLIGATAHYVTEVLDDGPIIEQDVVRIYHRDTIDDLIQKGRDIEKIVLSRAVRWHVENRVLLYGNKTVVFQ
ncbi:MAG TPA: formyltetrahydrofolate deformylase, partial [Terriglobales bacterium]|nr:formyltetrahydrofolate deformylase [Terriglobales bacterium]